MEFDFIRKYWWTALIIVVIAIISVAAYLYFTRVTLTHMDEDFLLKANSSILSGITIEDKMDDYAQMEGQDSGNDKPNNPDAYAYPFLDVKSASFNFDDEFMYVKIQYYATIPQKPVISDDDAIIDEGIKINIVDEKGEDQAIFFMDYSYVMNRPMIGSYYLNGPTGIREPESARFSRQDYDCKVYGGPGNDFLIGAFPYKNIGIEYGQTVYLAVSTEATSQKYAHASVDVLGGSGKMPAVVIWNTATNEYTVDDGFYKG